MADQLITFRQWIEEMRPAKKSSPCRGCDRPKFDGVKGDGLCAPCPRLDAPNFLRDHAKRLEQTAIDWGTT